MLSGAMGFMDENSNSPLIANYNQAVAAAASGQSLVSHLPARVTLETTSICNLRCVMCPQAIDAVDRPKHMSEQLFEQVRPALKSARWIQLNGIGEPLASPALWYGLGNDFFPSGAEVVFNTNMTLLNARRIDLLRNVKFSLALNISLDAAHAVTYRRIRKYEYSIPIENIRRLVEARGEAWYPRLMINMTLMRENIEEVVDFVDLAKSLGVDAVGLWHLNQMPEHEMRKYEASQDNWRFDYGSQGLWNYPKLSNSMLRAAIKRGEEIGMPIALDESKNAFFPEESEARDPHADIAVQAPARQEVLRDCPHPWESILVSSNGEVRPCCYSKPIGNLNAQNFEEIWNGAAYQALRQALSQNRMPELCSDAACKYVQNMPAAADLSETAPVAAAENTGARLAADLVSSYPRARSPIARIWRRAKRLVRSSGH
jgi:MoaA/NifB/PqqE/SkfB family radical SAM enzyme